MEKHLDWMYALCMLQISEQSMTAKKELIVNGRKLLFEEPFYDQEISCFTRYSGACLTF